jgi:protein SCO1/2
MIRQASHLVRYLLALTLLGVGVSVRAQQPTVADISKQIGIDQKLGNRVPAGAKFLDENGRQIEFGDLLGKRPLLVAPIFYTCTTACTVVMDNVMKTLAKATKGDRLRVGRDLDVVFVSINPKETPELALRKKNVMTGVYNQPGTEDGWHFLTGPEKETRRVTDALGFRYTYNPDTNRVNHPVGIMFVSPNGTISSYILGGSYPTEVVADDVSRAEKNLVGPKSETILLGCIMIDPITGQRSVVIENVVRIAAIFTMVAVGLWILMMSLSNRKAARQAEAR